MVLLHGDALVLEEVAEHTLKVYNNKWSRILRWPSPERISVGSLEILVRLRIQLHFYFLLQITLFRGDLFLSERY